MTEKPLETAQSDASVDLGGSDLKGRVPRVEFLDRSAYRQRRFRDAASLLPVIAAVLMILPLAWPRDTQTQGLTSDGMIYLFVLWIMLVLAAFGLSRVLRFPDTKSAGGRGKDGTNE